MIDASNANPCGAVFASAAVEEIAGEMAALRRRRGPIFNNIFIIKRVRIKEFISTKVPCPWLPPESLPRARLSDGHL